MKRDLDALSGRQFDLLVIGGGIYGACIARDASLRGLSVALVERSDFSSGTSHNSLKIIHSGIRYLQHLDFRRVRESLDERRIWLTIAPHLVRPLKFLIPTQGYLVRGPVALQAAMWMHRAMGLDWNRGVPRQYRIRAGRVRGRAALASAVPGLPLAGLSGVAVWHDGQVVDADRVVLECLQSAVTHGAVVANYARAESLLEAEGRVCGAGVVDDAGGRELEIRARVTVNASGPRIGQLHARTLGGTAARAAPPLAKNMNIVTRRPSVDHGIGIPSKRSSDAVIGFESRLFFVTPWKDVTVIGTTHLPFEGDPDDYRVTEPEIGAFIDEVNESWPAARLTRDDLLYVYSGLTPAEPKNVRGQVGRSRRADIIDHGLRHGREGLLSVVGVKYTTSRRVAEQAVNAVQQKLGASGGPEAARTQPLPGGVGWRPAAGDEREGKLADLLAPYGSRPPSGLAEARDPTEALAICARHAVREEMALEPDDFLLRRNDLAARGRLDRRLIRLACEAMGGELGWTQYEVESKCSEMCRRLRYIGGNRTESQEGKEQ